MKMKTPIKELEKINDTIQSLLESTGDGISSRRIKLVEGEDIVETLEKIKTIVDAEQIWIKDIQEQTVDILTILTHLRKFLDVKIKEHQQ